MGDPVVGCAYLKTPQAICKIIEIVASLIAVLMVGPLFIGAVIVVFEIAASISIIGAGIFLIMHLVHGVEKIKLSWKKIQICFQIVCSIYYVIALVLLFAGHNNYILLILGGIFGIIAVLAHMADAVIVFRE